MGPKKFTYIIALIITSYCYGQEKTEKFSFQNPKLSFEERVNDLVKHLTLEEKVSQMLNSLQTAKFTDDIKLHIN